MRKSERRKNAKNAQEMLVSGILDVPNEWPQEIVNNSSKLLWNISKRHRQSLPPKIKHWICRRCKCLLRPGLNARVRITNKIRKVTCLGCGEIRRYVCKEPKEVEQVV